MSKTALVKKPLPSTEDKAQQIVLATQEVVTAISHRAGKGITTNAEYLTSADDAKMLKRVLENIDSQRRELVDPLNDVVKKINSKVKPMTDTIKMLLDLCKTDIINYEHSERQKALAEAEKRAKKVERSAPELAADIRQNAATVPVLAPVTGISRRTRWTFEIQNANAVPREFMVLDMSKLQKFAEAMKGSSEVAGVRFFQETILGASGK